MWRRWALVAVAVALLAGSMPVVSAPDHEDDEDARLDWFGKLRIRPEFSENLSDVSLGREDSIQFWTYRVNLGFETELDMGVNLLFDGQAVGLFGEDSTPLRGSQSMDSTSAKFNFYRAYAEAKQILGEPFDLRVGRQPLVYGDEWLLGDLDFYGGTSWDGARGDFTESRGNVSVFYAKAAEVDSPENNAAVPLSSSVPPDISGDSDLYGIWTTWDLGGDHMLDVAAIYLNDHRDFDLIGSTVDAPFRDKRQTYTARWNWVPGEERGPMINLNAAMQRGSTASSDGNDTFDIKGAWAAEFTGGWRFMPKGEPAKIYGRFAHFTGEDSGTSRRSERFDIVAMDFHERYGYLDFWTGFFGGPAFIGADAGLQIYQIGFDVRIPDKAIRIKGYGQRMRREVQISDQDTIRNLGQEYGIAAMSDYGKNVALELGVAQLYPGTAFSFEEPLRGQNSVQRAYLNAVVTFR